MDKDTIREIWRVFLTTPTGFGVVATLSSRIDVGPLIKTLTRGYYNISQAFWETLVPSIIFVKIPLPHNYLSFISLMLIPISINVYFNSRTSNEELCSNKFWAYFSSMSILVFAYVFGLQADLWDGMPQAVLALAAIFIDFILWISFTSVLILSMQKILKVIGVVQEEKTKFLIIFCAVLAMFVQLFLYSLFLFDTPLGNGLFSEPVILPFGESVFLVVVTILGVLYTFKEKLKAPGYTLISVVGVFVFGWIVDDILPMIQNWFEKASIPPMSE